MSPFVCRRRGVLALPALVLLLVLGSALAGRGETLPELPFRRSAQTSSLRIGQRPRQTPHTQIYARIQPYDLYNNYLDEWIDRPLFHNRVWRDSVEGQENGFLRDVEAAQEYGLAGFTMLGSSYVPRYRRALQTLKQHQVQNFAFMPGLAWGSMATYDKYLANAKAAFASPYTPRIQGKVPFFSYVSAPLEEIKAIRERLAGDGFADILLFDNLWLDVFAEYQNTGGLSEATLAAAEAEMRRKLAVVDGLIFFAFHMHRDATADYTLKRRFYYELTEKYLVPLFEKVYREPEFSGKLLGFNLRHGYLGHMSGTNEAELGTSQLRDVLDIALLLNADILSLVEWNEANENTSFQPSVTNSRALQRLLRFYARYLQGLPAAPNPGDDTGIPNLVLSTRQTVKLGEKVRLELLNIPDGSGSLPYSVRLQLLDARGALLKSFADDRFIASELTAVTYEIPSEALAGQDAVLPVLTVQYQGREHRFEQLQYIRLDPTAGWNFKEIRQSLRDLLPLRQAELQAEWQADGSLAVQASIASDEPLASVEILDQEQEVAAYSRDPVWDPDQSRVILVRMSTPHQGLRPVRLSLPGCANFDFQPWGRPYSGFGKLTRDEGVWQGELLLWSKGADFLLSIPAAAEIGEAEIRLAIEGHGEVVLQLSTLLERQSYAVELPGPVQVQFFRRQRLPDHPRHPEETTLTLRKTLRSDFENPCLQLRVISRSGKIFRSRPLFPVVPATDTVQLPVFSAYAGERKLLQVPANRVPRLEYVFDSQHGDLLLNRGAGRWHAENGGGFRYLFPMNRVKLPDGVTRTTPEWAQDTDGTSHLRFDGISNYVIFPMEAFPTGAFTLDFEAWTDSTANQPLFRHGVLRLCSLDTFVIDGKLQAAYAEMGPNYLNPVQELAVNLDFPVGRWNRVRITYDLQEMVFRVNDQECRIPFSKRPGKPGTATFGGPYASDPFWEPRQLQYFKGKLRRFNISHRAQAEE